MSVKLMDCVARFFFTFSKTSTWKLVNANASILPILETLCTKMTITLMTEENVIVIFSV